MKNKLDPFAASLDAWDAEGKTLAEMVAALKEDGCLTSSSSLSVWLSGRRKLKQEKDFFALVATGGRMNRELDMAYIENPAPEIDQLIRTSKTLIMSLQVHGAANPKLLSLANAMQQTVLNYLSGKTKAELEARKLNMDERRVQVLEERAKKAREELQKLRDPKAQTSEEERKAIVDKVDEVLGLK